MPKFKNQRELFNWIRNNRKHKCCVTGEYFSQDMPQCFAHILGKGMHLKYKLYENNIALVKDIDAHYEVDRLSKGYAFVIAGMLDEGISADNIIKFLKTEKGE